jgi:hypothetical protein
VIDGSSCVVRGAAFRRPFQSGAAQLVKALTPVPRDRLVGVARKVIVSIHIRFQRDQSENDRRAGRPGGIGRAWHQLVTSAEHLAAIAQVRGWHLFEQMEVFAKRCMVADRCVPPNELHFANLAFTEVPERSVGLPPIRVSVCCATFTGDQKDEGLLCGRHDSALPLPAVTFVQVASSVCLAYLEHAAVSLGAASVGKSVELGSARGIRSPHRVGKYWDCERSISCHLFLTAC